jgi:hypothetical protein
MNNKMASPQQQYPVVSTERMAALRRLGLYLNRDYRKIGVIVWDHGVSDHDTIILDNLLRPAVSQLEQLFDDNRAILPKSSMLSWGKGCGHWHNCPRHIVDEVEKIIRSVHIKFATLVDKGEG